MRWVLSLLVHTAFLAVLLLLPLYFTQTLGLGAVESMSLIAPPPPPPPPASAPGVRREASRPVASFVRHGALVAPTAIPRNVAVVKEAPLPALGGQGGGVPGGVPGGQIGGVLGGILGGVHLPSAVPPPPAARRARAAGRILSVGGDLRPPKQVYSVDPVYPSLARITRISGTVEIEAVIDEQGNVVQARAVSGNPLLIRAALDAVAKWKYAPTLLNGDPIAVKMLIQVHFVLKP